jgi:hypothetical protein
VINARTPFVQEPDGVVETPWCNVDQRTPSHFAMPLAGYPATLLKSPPM